MNRHDVTEAVVTARLAKGLTWAELAAAVDRPVEWTTSALLGQQPIPVELGRTLAAMLDLPDEAVPVLAAPPMRGSLPTAIPADPTIYRLYEAISVYGTTIKELIHEEFGDGIMSAINFSLTVGRRPHEGGDRVRITLDGKFLPYDWTTD